MSNPDVGFPLHSTDGDTVISVSLESSPKGEPVTVEPSNEQINRVLDLFPQIDRSIIQLRIVPYFDEEYGISTDSETHITTITVGSQNSKKATIALCNALSELSQPTDLSESPTLRDLTEAGAAARDFANHSSFTFGATVGGMPWLLAMDAIGQTAESMQPLERQKRALARTAVKHGLRIF